MRSLDRTLVVVIAWCAATLLCADAHAQDDRKLALVIGNAAYASDLLRNPVNDARAVSVTLRDLGFAVIDRQNASLKGMLIALQEFSIRARKSQVRLIYYAGHGMQVKGRNYLIPIDADISSEDEIPRKSADVNDLLDRLGELRAGMNIVILDACRNNPFNNTPALNVDGRRIRTRAVGAADGLSSVEAPRGTLVAYSTSPGMVAIDSGSQKNSVYTKHLLTQLNVRAQTVEQMFKRIRVAVAAETQNLQVPWETSSLFGNFCFRSDAAGQCGP